MTEVVGQRQRRLTALERPIRIAKAPERRRPQALAANSGIVAAIKRRVAAMAVSIIEGEPLFDMIERGLERTGPGDRAPRRVVCLVLLVSTSARAVRVGRKK